MKIVSNSEEESAGSASTLIQTTLFKSVLSHEGFARFMALETLDQLKFLSNVLQEEFIGESDKPTKYKTPRFAIHSHQETVPIQGTAAEGPHDPEVSAINSLSDENINEGRVYSSMNDVIQDTEATMERLAQALELSTLHRNMRKAASKLLTEENKADAAKKLVRDIRAISLFQSIKNWIRLNKDVHELWRSFVQ